MLLSSLQQESGMRRRLFLQFSTHYIDIIHRIYTHCISFHILLIRNWFCIDGGNSTWKGSLRNVFAFRLVVATLGLELNPSAGHDAGGQHVTVKLLLRAEMPWFFLSHWKDLRQNYSLVEQPVDIFIKKLTKIPIIDININGWSKYQIWQKYQIWPKFQKLTKISTKYQSDKIVKFEQNINLTKM